MAHPPTLDNMSTALLSPSTHDRVVVGNRKSVCMMDTIYSALGGPGSKFYYSRPLSSDPVSWKRSIYLGNAKSEYINHSTLAFYLPKRLHVAALTYYLLQGNYEPIMVIYVTVYWTFILLPLTIFHNCDSLPTLSIEGSLNKMDLGESLSQTHMDMDRFQRNSLDSVQLFDNMKRRR